MRLAVSTMEKSSGVKSVRKNLDKMFQGFSSYSNVLSQPCEVNSLFEFPRSNVKFEFSRVNLTKHLREDEENMKCYLKYNGNFE